MKKTAIVAISIVASLAAIGASIGGAFAAYSAVQETFAVNSADNDIAIPSLAHAFGSNSGNGTTAGTALEIENPVHLRNLAKLQNAGYFDSTTFYFKVVSSFRWDDISEMAPIGNAVHPFTGVFDGNGKTISRAEVSIEDRYAGLFGVINGGTVKNLILGGPQIEITPTNDTANYIGFLAGYLQSGTIQDCFVYGGSATFTYNATLSSGGGKKVSCNDYFVGTGSGTETRLSFLSQVNETTYTTSPSPSWSAHTQCPTSASAVITDDTSAFSYSYYKASSSATTVTKRT